MSLLTPADVAAELGVSPRTVRRLLRGLVVVRIGRCVRVERAELDRWIRSQRERWASGYDGEGAATGKRSSTRAASGDGAARGGP